MLKIFVVFWRTFNDKIRTFFLFVMLVILLNFNIFLAILKHVKYIIHNLFEMLILFLNFDCLFGLFLKCHFWILSLNLSLWIFKIFLRETWFLWNYSWTKGVLFRGLSRKFIWSFWVCFRMKTRWFWWKFYFFYFFLLLLDFWFLRLSFL